MCALLRPPASPRRHRPPGTFVWLEPYVCEEIPQLGCETCEKNCENCEVDQICDWTRFIGRQFFNLSLVLNRQSLPAWPMKCVMGHYCDGFGTPQKCPAGVLGNTTGLETSACLGDCTPPHSLGGCC